MNTALVSIIIPCYNAEKYVAEAIQSALNQTYPNCEVIIIDDGSTDNSLEVIKSFGDRIHWETGPNRGACTARNRGIELSNGVYIKFLDSDDLLTQGCISNEVSHVLNTEENSIICSSIDVIPGRSPSKLSSKWLHKSYNIETLIFDGTPQTSAPLHKKKNLLKIGGFRDGLPCSQEYDLHLRLAIILGMQYYILPDIGTLIRPRPNSLSRHPEAPIAVTRSTVLIRLAEEYNQLKRFPTVKYKSDIIDLIAQALTLIARSLWRNKNRKQAIEIIKHARKLSSKWHQKAYRNHIIAIIPIVFGFSFYEKIHSSLTGIVIKNHK